MLSFRAARPHPHHPCGHQAPHLDLWAASALYTAATIVSWSATTTVTSGPAEPVEQPDPPIWTFFLLLVPAPVIIQLLGLSEAEAAQVIGARDRIDGFLSAEEVIAHT